MEEKIYPEEVEKILKEYGIPQEEVKDTIELLTFSFIAHL